MPLTPPLSDEYVRGWNDAITECAKICDAIDVEATTYSKLANIDYHTKYHHEGRADGADDCAVAIRSMKSGQ